MAKPQPKVMLYTVLMCSISLFSSAEPAYEDVQLNVLARIHFNTNVSDYDLSREFYRRLGMESGQGFPDTNTVAMAQSLGIATPTEYDGAQGGEAGGYLLHGQVITFGTLGEGAIDLIEFTIPRNEAPPYPRINRLGMAKAAMYTSDLDADHATLSAEGVAFIDAPVARADGTRFAIFKDPDGTFYELIEDVTREPASELTHISGLGPLTINVSNYERSRRWYAMFGYEETRRLDAAESLEVSRAMGFEEPIQVRGGMLTHRTDGSEIELLQWITPFDPTPPYPAPINHLGIHRTAMLTTDIDSDVEQLKKVGVEFISPITPCCSGPDSSGAIINFYDPDGTIVELAGMPGAGIFYRLILWFRAVFG